MDGWLYHVVLFGAGLGAGVVNAVAGGGPILTLGVLSLTGLDPRIANLTSTVALSPGQLAAGWSVRDRMRAVQIGRPLLLLAVAILGGAAGAGLLLATASPTFKNAVPWLVLLATAIYAAGGVLTIAARSGMFADKRIFPSLFAPLAVYGGYFGGGNSFLVLALLGLSGHEPRLSGEIKNMLIAAINLGAVLVFATSGFVNWYVAFFLGLGGVLGSLMGARMLDLLPVGLIRWIVIVGGLALAAWMFAR